MEPTADPTVYDAQTWKIAAKTLANWRATSLNRDPSNSVSRFPLVGRDAQSELLAAE
jgi:hypothetical protein